jgi:signal transduction histidine kinase
MMNESIRNRLSLFIFALLGLLGGLFASMAYYEVHDTLRAAGTKRIEAAATQVADLLAQSAAARLDETGRLARIPEVRTAVFAPSDDEQMPEVVRTLLARNPTVSLWISERDGTPVRRLGAGSELELSADTPPAPAIEGMSGLQVDGGRVWYTTTVAVSSGTPGTPSRLLSVRRSLGQSQAAAALERLIGSGAVLKFGNASGDVWTDLTAPTSAPPTAEPRVPTSFVDDAGEPSTGVAVVVPNTPWLLWVSAADADMLAPARELLWNMLPIMLGLMAAGAVALYVMSGRITRPITTMAKAAEIIAAGDYSHRVEIERQDEVGRLGTAFNSMVERVSAAHESLERRVSERTEDLAAANSELEAFSYSVSHDLRAPLRHIAGFAALLEKHAAAGLDEQGRRYLTTISSAAAQMGRLVDDLLQFSRMGRTDMHRGTVNLTATVQEAIAEVAAEAPDRKVEWTIRPLPDVIGDPAMLRLAVANLVQNAHKYTRHRDVARIEIGEAPPHDGEHVIYVKDNGAGFDMAYADKLFGVFQRLHRSEEFEGTGIGLANVRRIIHRHGGRTWAEGTVDRGATFYFSIPANDQKGCVAS